MRKSIISYVNSLKTIKSFQAVSFEMHSNIGKALDGDNADIESSETVEKILLDSNEINFMP